MSLAKIFGSAGKGDDDHWITVSDLMSGLMVIFLFIAITYIRPIVETQNTIKEIVVAWKESEVDIHNALEKEFARDLIRWNAVIDKDTLSVQFKAPDVLFDPATSDLKPEFRQILSDFFPRYATVLHGFRQAIAEVRIEGHTSTEWIGTPSRDDAYFRNMALSQARTRSVLQFCLGLPDIRDLKRWAQDSITANGLSSSRPILRNGIEDKTASRRVEFRVLTKTKEQIVRILETIR